MLQSILPHIAAERALGHAGPHPRTGLWRVGPRGPRICWIFLGVVGKHCLGAE